MRIMRTRCEHREHNTSLQTVYILCLFAICSLVLATNAFGAQPELVSDISPISNIDTGLIERLKAWVTYALGAIGGCFYGIGIDIGRLVRLAGELIVGIFEALAQFARWLFSLGGE